MSEDRTSGATASQSLAEAKTEGWYGPPNSRRFHYFREGRSLCGKWAVFLPDEDIPYDKAFGPADGDCAACKRALEKTATAQAVAPKDSARPAPKPERKG